MRSRWLIGPVLMALAVALCAAGPAAAPLAPGEAEARAAAVKAIALVQQSVTIWDSKRSCLSCHHQHMPISLLRAARQHGVAFDEAAARQTVRRLEGPASNLDFAVQATMQIDPTMDTGSTLNSLTDAGLAPTLSTGVYARRLATRQYPDGHWITIDVRPPQAYSTVTATAVAARAIRDHLPASMQAERDEVLGRARRWLEAAAPRDTEDRAFQLLGLGWTGASPAAIDACAKALVAEQRPDGGWAQLPRLSSDAYATGQALVVLQRVAMLPRSHPAVVRGLAYLLSTQRDDGSWHVRTRLHEPDLVSPPYFETGFPHGPDQFVAIMGTAWAAMAMLESLPVTAPGATMLPARTIDTPDERPWMQTTLFGTRAALEALLDAGLDPNSSTPAGTTALMMAAHDPDKAALLLKRGADVTAISGARHTALMVAAHYPGTVETMRRMLDAGASALPAPPAAGSTKVFAPILYALWAGEPEKVALLMARGAPLPKRVLLLGGEISATPLELAVFVQNEALVRLLASRGASLTEMNEIGIPVLTQAVLANNAAMVRLLIELGAPVNLADQQGETALMHAATIDYGDTSVIESLVRAGADRTAKSPDGLTAAAMARKYGHSSFAPHLE